MSEPTSAGASVVRPGEPGYDELVAEAERQAQRARETERA